MSSTNATLATNPRSRIPLELWTPYVLIGVSCVIFLAGHFWCYHKRNRIRYLRKREEARVKSGLLERRRITTLLLARYQSDLGIPQNNETCNLAVPTTWDDQGKSSESGSAPHYSQAHGVAAASDTMEIVLEGVLASPVASRESAVQESNVSMSRHQRNSKGLYTIEQSMAEYQRLNRPLLDNMATMKQVKTSPPNQANHRYYTKIWPNHEPCHKNTELPLNPDSRYTRDQQAQYFDPGSNDVDHYYFDPRDNDVDHTPQVIGIFNLADRCTLCGECSILQEKYCKLSETGHDALRGEDIDIPLPTVDKDHSKYNKMYTPLSTYPQDGNRSKQTRANNPTRYSKSITTV